MENSIIKTEPVGEDVPNNEQQTFQETDKLIFEKAIVKSDTLDESDKSFGAETLFNAFSANEKFISGCQLVPVNLLKIKEEKELTDEDVWTDSRQKSLDNQPLKCIVLPVKQENDTGLFHGSKNLSLEDRKKESLLHNLVETEESNSIFGHENKSKPLISRLGTSLQETPDLHRCEVCSKPKIKQGICSCHERILPTTESHKRETRTFSSKTSLNLDEEVHSGIKPHKCEICAKAFTRKANLNIHKRIHSGIKPYKCEICSKTYTTKPHLTEHERIHFGIKPYNCETCSQNFTRKGDLTRHEQIHSGTKPYKCEICSRTFTQKGKLEIHKRIHSVIKPYQCEICVKGFTRKAHLNVHKQIHSGTKPYKCEICSKAFTTKSHLNEHERIHFGIKPYKCEMCSRNFTRKGDLTRHERIHFR